MEEIKYQTVWNPEEDITTFELAKCLPYAIMGMQDRDVWDKLDWCITRHFDVSEFNYGDMIRENAQKIKELWEDDEDE